MDSICDECTDPMDCGSWDSCHNKGRQQTVDRRAMSDSTKYLQDLAETLRRIPVKYGTDDGDISRLYEIARETEELLDLLQQAHRTLDLLLAQVATLENKFAPTKSPAWPTVIALHDALKKHGRFQ